MGNRVRIFLIFLLLMIVFPKGSASAYEGVCGSNITWKLEYGELTISGSGEMNDWLYSDYSRIGKLDLYSTGFYDSNAPWTPYRDEIRIVKFQGNITNIGSGAFLGCGRLKQITMPDSIIQIGDGAFMACTGLEEIVIPNSVSDIGSDAFEGCSGLKSVSLPAALNLSANPSGYTIVNPFDGCTAITDIHLTGSGDMCNYTGKFSGERNNCTPWRVSSDAGNQVNITIEPGVTSIGASAFYKCSGLNSIVISNSVTKIGYAAFQSCSGLSSVTIPSSVDEISSSAFNGCISLKDIYYTGQKEKWESRRILSSIMENDAEAVPGELLIRMLNEPLQTAQVHFIAPEENKPNDTEVSVSGFPQTKNYVSGQFADVPGGSWYEEAVKTCYEMSIMNGTSSSLFSPQGSVTVAEAITMASRIHASLHGISVSFPSSDPWYASYVDYALSNRITGEHKDYNLPISRAEFTEILSNSLDDSDVQEISSIEEGAIPDIDSSSRYYEPTYRMYRAGILTGNDENGTFYPDSNILRTEAAAIVSRIIVPSQRKTIILNVVPFEPVPMNQLANLTSLRQGLTDAQLKEAYDIAVELVRPYAKRTREDQLKGIVSRLSAITAQNEYSMSKPHYSDPYGYFVLHVSSCAGWTRATGLCLNILGIPYEHMNANQYDHQWCRVKMDDGYWVCDAGVTFSAYAGPETNFYRELIN